MSLTNLFLFVSGVTIYLAPSNPSMPTEVPLRLINVQLRTVLAVGGVGGLAVGLALQNLVQNLISGRPSRMFVQVTGTNAVKHLVLNRWIGQRDVITCAEWARG